MSLMNWPEAGAPDPAKIEDLLRGAVALDPRMADAHLQLGILYSGQRKMTEAIAEREKAVTQQPALETAHYRLGQALTQVGERVRGRKELAIFSQLHSTEQEREHAQILQFSYTEQVAGLRR